MFFVNHPNPQSNVTFDQLPDDFTLQSHADYLAKHYGTDVVLAIPSMPDFLQNLIILGYPEDVCKRDIETLYKIKPIKP
ncbi:hypothetical protein D3C85_1746960 [compost metagenome]